MGFSSPIFYQLKDNICCQTRNPISECFETISSPGFECTSSFTVTASVIERPVPKGNVGEAGLKLRGYFVTLNDRQLSIVDKYS